jgi:hypothetical protein
LVSAIQNVPTEENEKRPRGSLRSKKFQPSLRFREGSAQ